MMATPSPLLDPTYMDILPVGSRSREDLAQYRVMGPFRRPTTLPIEIGPG
jgi:hypothetical protein